MKNQLLALLLLSGCVTLQSAPLLTENFNDITLLAGAGWVQTNNSAPLGATNWSQGNPTAFSAQSGPNNSFISANFRNASFGGNVSNWLILPSLTLGNGDVLTFWTRSAGGFVDGLEVRLNTANTTNVGASDTSVGDFTTLLLSVNPTLSSTGYPTAWTQYTVNITGLAAPTQARLAFRYVVQDTSQNGNYIGIDTVSVDSPASAAPVPEPGSLALLGASLSGLVFAARKRRG